MRVNYNGLSPQAIFWHSIFYNYAEIRVQAGDTAAFAAANLFL